MPFDILLDVPGGSPHVDRQRRDRNRGDNPKDALPESLICRAGEQKRRANADGNRETNSPVDRREEPKTTALFQKGDADGNDEEGFEPFTQSDDECLKHVSVPSGWLNENQSQSLGGPVYFGISDQSSREYQ